MNKINQIYTRVNNFTIKAIDKLRELGYDEYLNYESNEDES